MGKKLRDAMNAEWATFLERGVVRIAKIPKGVNPIPVYWKAQEKRNADGDVTRLKARLVADGRCLKQGIDFQQSFSSVVNEATLRTLLHVASAKGYSVDTIDVTAAYLYAPINETVYIQFPEFIDIDRKPGHCYVLEKSMYGLPQSGRNWFKTIKATLERLGFSSSQGDQCLMKRSGSDGMEYVAIYVDDLCIVTPNDSRTRDIKEAIVQEYDIKDGGQMTEYLGLRIERNPETGRFEISQAGLIREVLEDHCESAHAISQVPMASTYRPSSGDEQNDAQTIRRYQAAIGSLMYLSRMSRPDIAFATCLLARYASRPAQDHFKALQRILHYLRATMHFRLVVGGESGWKAVEGFSDSDWAGSCLDQKSTSGCLVKAGASPLIWSSSKQSVVAKSTMAAEGIALGHALDKTRCVSATLTGMLETGEQGPTPILSTDNMPLLQNVQAGRIGSKSRAVMLQLADIFDAHAKGEVVTRHVRSQENPADMFTKPLGKDAFWSHLPALGLQTALRHGGVCCA
jgi:hypothetical protein